MRLSEASSCTCYLVDGAHADGLDHGNDHEDREEEHEVVAEHLDTEMTLLFPR